MWKWLLKSYKIIGILSDKIKDNFIFFIFLNFILFLNLKHCISFAKHQNESATGILKN